MTLDFGETLPLQRVEILWEFVAKSFAISTSSDGLSWAEVYATDLNGLKKTAVNLGHQSARKLRLTMREVHAPHSSCVCICIAERRCFLQAHPSRGMYLGHAAFGVKSLKVFGAASGITAEDCGSSASSSDAGDKWFFVAVSESDTCASRSLRAELPSYEAAKASLSATVGELDAALPSIAMCEPSLAAGTFGRVGGGPSSAALVAKAWRLFSLDEPL